MKSNVGCRLRRNIWSAASPFLGPRAQHRIPLHTNSTIFANTFCHAGSKGLTYGHVGPPPGPWRLAGIQGVAARSSLTSWRNLMAAAREQSTSTYAKEIGSSTKSKKTTLDRRKTSRPVDFSPERQFRSHRRGISYGAATRNMSSTFSNRTTKGSAEETVRDGTCSQKTRSPQRSVKDAATLIANKHLIDRLPNIPHLHRPSKEELLAAATGFWSRMKIRFKWFSIRSVRPFNADEIGAFFSWVLLGHVLWIILGTTTFFSLAIFAVNTVFAQGKFRIHYKIING